VLIAEGDPAGASRELRMGITAWQEVGSPYEVARARVVLSRVYRSLGAVDDAALELRAALDAFRTLGAGPDLAAAEREALDLEPRHDAAVAGERTFLFTDIVGSTALAESVGDDVWTSVLRWHDTTLADLIARGSGRVVKSTGDGFFAAFDSARDAVDTAIAIQRTLRGHRRDSGYPARVRIGIHTGDATERGGDFAGLAVHMAARVAALAQADEIIVSATTLRAADGTPTADPRTVAVKGVREPVEIASVSWD
jgi:class 3 adenylate cyclase